MADEINIISDKDLQAPLALGKNYQQLANDFEAVAASASIMMKKIEGQDAKISELNAHTKQLEQEVKNLEEANKKAAKAQEKYTEATAFADKATGGMIGKVKALGKEFLVLLTNPIVAFFAAIAGAVAAIGVYFKSTNEGADKFEKIMATLGGIVNFFTNKIADLGEQIVKLFEDGNALGEVFKFVFDQVVNRVAGVIDAFTSILKVINILARYNLKDILTGKLKPEDIAALKNEMTNLGKAGVAALTGIGDAADKAADSITSLNELTEAQQKLGDEIRDRILSKAQSELEIEKLLFAAKDKANHSDEERLALLKQAVKLSEDQLKIDIELATRRERLFTAQLLLDKGIISSAKEYNKVVAESTTLLQDQALEQKASDEQLEERRKLQAEIFNLQRNFFAENKKNIAQIGALQDEIDTKAAESAALKVTGAKVAARLQLETSKELNTQELTGFKTLKDEQDAMNKRFNQRLIDDRKARDAAEKELDKKRTEEYIEEQEKRRAIAQAALQAIAMVGNEIFARRQEKLDEELKASEARRAVELAGAEDDERKKLAINRKFDREQARIKTKQAQADKQAALFNIVINTAAAITRVAPNPILIALVAALGLVQGGIVASRPLPKFWKGTRNAPDSFIAGDRGRELVQRGNEAFIAEKPTIFTGMEGAKVFTKQETDNILGSPSDVGRALNYGSRIKHSLVNNTIVADRLNESNKLLKKIASKPVPVPILDEAGFGYYLDRMEQRNARINKRFRGR